MKKWLGLLCLIVLLVSMVGCSADDPLTEDLYITNLYGETINGTVLKVPHADTHETSGSDELLNLNQEVLGNLLYSGNVMFLPTNAGWYTSVNGTGAVTQVPMRILIGSGTTANSKATAITNFYGFYEGSNYYFMDFSKKIYIVTNFSRLVNEPESRSFFQIKAVNATGNMTAKGMGFLLENRTLYGESYGTAENQVNLGTVLFSSRQYQIAIILNPITPAIYWYVNGVLVGSQLNANYIPSGSSDETMYFIISYQNGATGGIASYISVMQTRIWQER